MWTTLALVATLGVTPTQSGKLAITNIRATYGLLGSTRPDNKFLPGDDLFLSFDIQGVQVDESGKVLYSIAMEVTNAKGKTLFKQTPRKLEANNSLGGTSLPGFASLKIGLDAKPGKYKVKVKVTDRAAKASASLTRTYEVLRPAFGLVRLATTSDPEGQVPTPFFAVGQTLWINFAAVGFGRDESSGSPNLTVTLRVLDAEGQPAVAKPFTGKVTDKDKIPKKARHLPLQFALQLNRPGKFTVELKAADNVSGKTATLKLPLTVLQAK
jgi:hypothetical protein